MTKLIYRVLILMFLSPGLYAQTPPSRPNCGAFAGRTICVGQQAVMRDERDGSHRRIWGLVSQIDVQRQIVRVDFNGHIRSMDFHSEDVAHSLRTREDANGHNTYRVGMGVTGCGEAQSAGNNPSLGIGNVRCRHESPFSGRIIGVFRNSFQGREGAPLYAVQNEQTRTHKYTFYLSPVITSAPGIASLTDLLLPVRDSVHSVSLSAPPHATEFYRLRMGPHQLESCVRACQLDFQSSGRCQAVGFIRNQQFTQAECRLLSSADAFLMGNVFSGREEMANYLNGNGNNVIPLDYQSWQFDRAGGTAFDIVFFPMLSVPTTSSISNSFYADEGVPNDFLGNHILFPAIYLRVFPIQIHRLIDDEIAPTLENYQIVTSGNLSIYSPPSNHPYVHNTNECRDACNNAGTDCVGFQVARVPYVNADLASRPLRPYSCRLVKDAVLEGYPNLRHAGQLPLDRLNLSSETGLNHTVFAAKLCIAQGAVERHNLFGASSCGTQAPPNSQPGVSTSPGRNADLSVPAAPPVWRFVNSDIEGYDKGHFAFTAAEMNGVTDLSHAEALCRSRCSAQALHASPTNACNAFSVQLLGTRSQGRSLCWIKHLPPASLSTDNENRIIPTPTMTTVLQNSSLTVLLPLVRSNLAVDLLGRCQSCSSSSAPHRIHRNAIFNGYELARRQLVRQPRSTNVIDQCLALCAERAVSEGCNTVRITQSSSNGLLWSCMLQAIPPLDQRQPRALPQNNRQIVFTIQ